MNLPLFYLEGTSLFIHLKDYAIDFQFPVHTWLAIRLHLDCNLSHSCAKLLTIFLGNQIQLLKNLKMFWNFSEDSVLHSCTEH
jgi:hypothetical protein